MSSSPDHHNIVFVSDWLARNARERRMQATVAELTEELARRVSALSRDLRDAAASGEAKDPVAAVRIANDLERMASAIDSDADCPENTDKACAQPKH